MSQTNAVFSDRERGVRLTHNDSTVLACLRQQSGPMKAYDLLESLRGEGINAPMTVYRALSRLTGHGLVKKIESINAFYAIPEGEKGHIGAFFISAETGAMAYRLLDDQQIEALGGSMRLLDASIELTVDRLSEELTPISRSEGDN